MATKEAEDKVIEAGEKLPSGKTYGPYDEYKEIPTDRGVFGLEPGQKLILGDKPQVVDDTVSPHVEEAGDVPVIEDADGGEVVTSEGHNTGERQLLPPTPEEDKETVDLEEETAEAAEQEEATKEALLEQAAELDIKGRSSMNKEELRDAIAAAGG
jgi:hypothetical protein